jgi:hypothetical protein
VFLDTALLETLLWSSLPSTTLSAHPLQDVRPAMTDAMTPRA